MPSLLPVPSCPCWQEWSPYCRICSWAGHNISQLHRKASAPQSSFHSSSSGMTAWWHRFLLFVFWWCSVHTHLLHSCLTVLCSYASLLPEWICDRQNPFWHIELLLSISASFSQNIEKFPIISYGLNVTKLLQFIRQLIKTKKNKEDETMCFTFNSCSELFNALCRYFNFGC